jgi:hypothetical protein
MQLGRQEDILPQRAIEDVHVIQIGVGGIGSWVGLEIAKMGIEKITAYDHDVVAPENPSSQFYRPKLDIGKMKVDAFKEIVEMFSTAEVTAIPEKFPIGSRPNGIVISAVDDMDLRIDIWHKSIKYNPNVPLYIEARMAVEELHVFPVIPTDPDSVARYEGWLYPSSEAFHAPCTAKAIAYTTTMAGAVIARELKAFLTGEKLPFDIMGLKSRMWVVQ